MTSTTPWLLGTTRSTFLTRALLVGVLLSVASMFADTVPQRPRRRADYVPPPLSSEPREVPTGETLAAMLRDPRQRDEALNLMWDPVGWYSGRHVGGNRELAHVLGELLGTGDVKLRLRVAWQGLGALSDEGLTSLAPAVSRSLRTEEDALVRVYVLWFLLNHPVAATVVMPDLEGIADSQTAPLVEVGLAHAAIVKATGEAGERVKALVGIYQNTDDPELRNVVVSSLTQIGPPAESAAPFFIDLVRRREEDQDFAALGLKATGAGGQAAVEALCDLAMDGNVGETDRSCAIEALSAYGDRREEFLGVLLLLMDGPEDHLRAKAVRVMARLGPRDEKVIRRLERLLTDADATVRCAAAEAFLATDLPLHVKWNAIKPIVQEAGPPWPGLVAEVAELEGPRSELADILIEGLEAPFHYTRVLALEALGQLRCAPAREALSKMLRDPDCELVAAAVESLGRMGPYAAAAAADVRQTRDLFLEKHGASPKPGWKWEPDVADICTRALLAIEGQQQPPTHQ